MGRDLNFWQPTDKWTQQSYLQLSNFDKRIWQKSFYRDLQSSWIEALHNGDWDGSLCEFAWHTLHVYENKEYFETCQGIIETINEYHKELRCR